MKEIEVLEIAMRAFNSGYPASEVDIYGFLPHSGECFHRGC